MENVLDCYNQLYDPKRPLWCVDERPCQLLGDVLVPIPMKPKRIKREDYHYKRMGTCTILIAFQPHTGQRVVKVYKHRGYKEYAEFMLELKNNHCPDAEQLVVVQDNLSTHTQAAFYAVLPPDQALETARKFEMHFTPTNASWLNMVEIELSVLSQQCLNRRIDSMEFLNQEVQAWATERNSQQATVHWQFTPELAREKFKRHYPDLS